MVKRSHVLRLATAIAEMEGYFVSAITIPQQANNPGDLENGNIGHGVLEHKTIYETAYDGWSALFNQIMEMVDDKSRFYNRAMTLQKMALVYSDSSDYAAQLCEILGVSPLTTLGEYLTDDNP